MLRSQRKLFFTQHHLRGKYNPKNYYFNVKKKINWTVPFLYFKNIYPFNPFILLSNPSIYLSGVCVCDSHSVHVEVRTKLGVGSFYSPHEFQWWNSEPQAWWQVHLPPEPPYLSPFTILMPFLMGWHGISKQSWFTFFWWLRIFKTFFKNLLTICVSSFENCLFN